MELLIIGCGSMGSVIAKSAEKTQQVERVLLFDHDVSKSETLAASLSKAEVVRHLDFKETKVDLTIEAASQKAAKEIIPLALDSGSDAMVMSVGSFVDRAFQEGCFSAAKQGRSVLIPSGAVAGIDALKAAGRAKLETVRLTSTKPPKGLTGVKYLIDKEVKVEEITSRTVLYSGPASQAVQYFPANVNVAATVSLAGVGFERTQVEVVCDPASKTNMHHLYAKGEFGELEATTRNLPSPDNPRTSYLASLSAASCLNSYISRVWIGV